MADVVKELAFVVYIAPVRVLIPWVSVARKSALGRPLAQKVPQ